jgi:hypothetical protein
MLASLIFLVGALLGILIGGALCVRYLRREIAADIGPCLRRMQAQLDILEATLNLALTTRYAELSERAVTSQAQPARPSALR